MLKNEDYKHIVNVSPQKAIQNIVKAHLGYDEAQLQNWWPNYNRMSFQTVKPWIPYAQFNQYLISKNIEVLLRPNIDIDDATKILDGAGGIFKKVKLINDLKDINLDEALIFSNDQAKIPQYGFYIAPRKT